MFQKTLTYEGLKYFSLATLLAVVAGCGGTSYVDPPVLPVAPVSGSVKFGSEVPAGAQLTFVPVARTEEGIQSSAVVRPDGTFRVSTYGTEDGAPVGEYVVLAQWFKPVKGEDGNAGGPNVFPKTYADPTKSPIKVTVKEGSNELPAIVVSKK
jgi:hypothetical protein